MAGDINKAGILQPCNKNEHILWLIQVCDISLSEQSFTEIDT